MSAWPVVVVTGANAGVGFGISRRLIFQLSPNEQKLRNKPFTMKWTRTLLDCERVPGYDGRADNFRRNLKIETEHLDLSVLSSVFTFGENISKRHAYISHLVLNAGVANFTHVNWLGVAKQFVCNGFLSTITAPAYYVQSTGEVTADGLGFVWQSNLFGHYVLFRVLEPLLQNPAYSAESRVVWSSSIEASPKFYDEDDWQLVKTDHSYEAVKYQIDLIGTILDRKALEIHPASKYAISTNLVAYGGFLDTMKVLVFYVGRFLLGSRNHPITPDNSAVVAVHLVLVAISFITFSAESNPVRFGAETDRWGNPAVGLSPVREWEKNRAHGEFLVEQCDELYREFAAKRESK
ncbi:3-keto sterol reductase [Roridomyces roridus]|uniref:3-keto sterol reductase n=1 Tax=Roridomyces roridus TaxID=1738132 RepID=A0AAD7C3X5_9AGAR|nr:3-keto sterol reductase [Roridomyces roridus]